MNFSEGSSNASILNALFIKDSVSSTPNHKGQCTKEKCVRTIEKRLPPIHQPNLKDEEAWNVKSLPTHWVPISKPSRVIENLVKKRQEQHEATINRVTIQFETINLDVEAQIRLNSEMLKCDFGDIENKKQKCLEMFDVDSKEMLALSKENFETVTETTLNLHKKRVTKIENLYTFLQELEKLRSNKFKKVLKCAYEELHNISYKLPNELQQYFEHEILQINQVLLSNLRCYADLQLRLNLQAENANRMFLQKLDTVKTKWRDIKREDALRKLNENRLISPNCEALLLKTEQGKTVNSLFVAKEHSMEEMWTHLSPLPITSKEVNVWSKCMQDTINGLDTCARKLIILYRMAVVTVFNGYFDELQNLTENMLEMGLVDTPEISLTTFDFCQPTIETVTRQYSDGLFNLETLWDSIIENLETKLQTTYMFLHGAGHLWDNHYQRIAEAKRIVLKDLKKVIEKNNKATQDQEIKLNIILDQLRQAPSEAKLEDALDDANNLLDNLQKAYTSHYGAEVKTVEKYQTIVEMEAEALIAELTLFLHAHPKNTEKNPTALNKRGSQCSLNNDRPWVLPQQMKQCEYQVAAVENWMFGLWEAIEKYVFTCKEEIVQQAQVWISERIKQLEKRLEVKIACHSSRYSRIKINVYDIRLAELKTHFERIARHKAGAENDIENIKQSYSIYETQYTNVLESYHKKIKSIQSKMQNARNSVTITAYIGELNYNTNLCNQKINDFIDLQETKYNLILYKIRKMAVEFSKRMKLFLEEGNFHYEEAKLITKDLKKFEKTIKKKYNAIKKEIRTKEKKIFVQVQKQETESLQRLNSSLEEFEFNENASTRIKDLQAEIRTEVYNVKFLIKKLENPFNEIEGKRIINSADVSQLDQFVCDFNDFTSAMVEISHYLYQQEPVINASKKDLNNLTTTTSQQQNDYANLLFENAPTENDSFMSKICCYLQMSLKLIQSEAEDFYRKHGEIQNIGKIQLSYNEFMKEVFAKYNYYHLQCELLWLDLVNEFMRMIQRLQKLACTYRNEFLKQHHTLHIETFLGKHKELVAEITKIKNNNKQCLHQLYERLKPLYGCKRNKPLLEKLQNEMAETMEQMRNFDINTICDPYKESQEEHITRYEQELHKAESKLAMLCDDSFGELLNSPLIKQFEEKLAHTTDLFAEDLPQTDGVDAIYYEQMRTLKIPSEYETNLKNTQVLQYQNIVDSSYFDDQECMPSYEFLEKFNEEHIQSLAAIEDVQCTWNVDGDYYEKIFKDSVQKILKLFTIKYNNLPPQ